MKRTQLSLFNTFGTTITGGNFRFLMAGFLVAFIVFTLNACGGSPATLTQANLDKIQTNMSSADVKAILGEPTSSTSEPIPIVGGTKTTYTYDNKQDHVVIILKNDSVQSKEGQFTSQ